MKGKSDISASKAAACLLCESECEIIPEGMRNFSSLSGRQISSLSPFPSPFSLHPVL